MDHEKITETIRKMIADRNARSAAEREKIYAAARAALERTASANPTAIMELEAAINAVEAGYAASPEKPAPAAPVRHDLIRFLAATAATAIVGALVASLIVAASFPVLLREGKAIDKLKAQYDRTLPQVPVAVDFLQKVSDAMIKMQKADGAAVAAKAYKKYISLQALDPALAKQMPSTLPPGTSIIVRANEDDFKILFNWTLCGAVRIAKPEMVDPVRNKADVVGCPFFGLWTAGAAKW